MEQTALFSRATLAGYDRETLSRSVVSLIGCGAAGNNIALTLALSGVGELRLLDPDVVEPSNLTRSPLFRRERLVGGRARFKARELAVGALSFAYASDPVVRFAPKRVEEVGLGGLAGSDVIISAVDSFTVRAYLADASRLLGIPLVELGFSAPRGHVSVFPNRAPHEPCWRCLHPAVSRGGVSCTTYAEAVVAEGGVPATQTVAAVFAALASEAAVQALHDRFPLGGRLLQLDVRAGRSSIATVSSDPCCPGVHRRLSNPLAVEVPSTAPLGDVFAALGGRVASPVIRLYSPFVVELPCAECGHSVKLGRPAFAIAGPPRCATCPASPVPSVATVIHEVRPEDPDARRLAKRFGLGPGGVLEVEDESTGTIMAIRLAGDSTSVFTTLQRRTSTVESSATHCGPVTERTGPA